jgi:hypothetical protein
MLSDESTDERNYEHFEMWELLVAIFQKISEPFETGESFIQKTRGFSIK